jgi:hypothetical protein
LVGITDQLGKLFRIDSIVCLIDESPELLLTEIVQQLASGPFKNAFSLDVLDVSDEAVFPLSELGVGEPGVHI